MDDDPWISWKMAQTDDELHKSGQSHEKAERSDCDTKGTERAGPMNASIFLFFFGLYFGFILSLAFVAAVGSGGGGVRARSNPAEFPTLAKITAN